MSDREPTETYDLWRDPWAMSDTEKIMTYLFIVMFISTAKALRIYEEAEVWLATARAYLELADKVPDMEKPPGDLNMSEALLISLYNSLFGHDHDGDPMDLLHPEVMRKTRDAIFLSKLMDEGRLN